MRPYVGSSENHQINPLSEEHQEGLDNSMLKSILGSLRFETDLRQGGCTNHGESGYSNHRGAFGFGGDWLSHGHGAHHETTGVHKAS